MPEIFNAGTTKRFNDIFEGDASVNEDAHLGPDLGGSEDSATATSATEANPSDSSPSNSSPIDASDTSVSRQVDDYSNILREETPSRNPLASFAAKPLKLFFEAQNEEEKVLLLLRQHPITQIKYLLIALILIALPFFLSYFPFFSFLSFRYHVVAIFGWYLMTLGFSLEAFLDWFFNVYIITDERIIDIDFYSLLFKNVAYAKIDKIEDVTATTGGTLGSVFDFGTVKIQTAASTDELEFEDVPQPNKVAAFINELILEEEQEKIEGRVR